jgi:hypothetical protein
MDLVGLIHSPANHIAEFSQKQVLLYRNDPGFQDYFEALQLDQLTSRRARSAGVRASSPLLSWTIRCAYKLSGVSSRRKLKADVLVCPNPDLRRKTEASLFVRILLGIARTDAKIICLLPADSPCRNELTTQLEAEGRSGQVEFIDPVFPLNPIEGRLRSKLAWERSRSAFREAVQILEPHGLSPGLEVEAGFHRLANYVEAWERLAPFVEFDAVVARCHWHALCSPVCRTARQRGKPVIAFQQGVIGHTLDVPVTASKYVAFGEPSARFLEQMNRRFFQAVGMPEPPVEYVNGGSLIDEVIDLPDQFERQTLLLVDVPVVAGDFYGVQSQCDALLELAERLLNSDAPLRRVIIRPHPYWNNLDLDACQRLARQHPGRCELSHPSWSLEDDLRRSSVIAGIFSGVLAAASACGLPAIFLETENGYTSGEFACFSPQQTLLPEAAFRRIVELLTDGHAFAKARMEVLKNAREYFANRASIDTSAAFFARLLQPKTAENQSCGNLK